MWKVQAFLNKGLRGHAFIFAAEKLGTERPWSKGTYFLQNHPSKLQPAFTRFRDLWPLCFYKLKTPNIPSGTRFFSPLQIEPAEAAASDIGGATISINLAHVLGNRELMC